MKAKYPIFAGVLRFARPKQWPDIRMLIPSAVAAYRHPIGTHQVQRLQERTNFAPRLADFVFRILDEYQGQPIKQDMCTNPFFF
jgi:hypothetical protein